MLALKEVVAAAAAHKVSAAQVALKFIVQQVTMLILLLLLLLLVLPLLVLPLFVLTLLSVLRTSPLQLPAGRSPMTKRT